MQTFSDYALESHRVQPAGRFPTSPAACIGRRPFGSASRRTASLAGSASPEAAEERRAHPDPKAWLDHIEKMQAVGLSSAAEQEMRLFRDAYPAYPVP